MRKNILSGLSQALIWAYEKGYRVINGEVISHKGKKLKLGEAQGYKCFTASPNWNGFKTYKIKVHRLAAYQKFGDKIFNKNLVVRHFDENPLNNSPENLLLGTYHDNSMDRSPEKRLLSSLAATVVNRKFTDAEIELIRQDFKINKLTYPQIMAKWNISSKGTLSYIINHKYKTRK